MAGGGSTNESMADAAWCTAIDAAADSATDSKTDPKPPDLEVSKIFVHEKEELTSYRGRFKGPL